ncbi:Phage peptidoglycan binding peptidase [Minicystis rosea]|nr:Phage peptidoglycan binding peptidase [Minicystis rosea]
MLRRSFVFLTCLLIGCSSEPSPNNEDPEKDAGVADAPTDAPTDPKTIEDTPITPRYQALVDSIEKERAQHGNPGVAALVLENGKITFARGFGSRDPDKDDPVHATTLFRIGSVTKMLTTTAVLKEVAAKKIALEDKVTTLIPGFNIGGEPGEDSLTLFNLLSHSSGINDLTLLYGENGQLQDTWLAKFTTGGFKTQGYFMAPPGRMYNYANPNFALAGLVAERSSGTIYRTTMQNSVFDPLGMTRTFFLGTDVEADGDYASANTINLETNKPEKVGPTSYDEAWSRPAGFAWSSVRDLAVFLQFLMNGNPQVLPDELRLAMQSPQMSTKLLNDHNSYGFGLTVADAELLGSPSQLYPMKVVSHAGSIPGYSANFAMRPDLGFAFITLSNTDDAYFQDSYEVALKTLTDLPASVPIDELKPDASFYDKYAGEYDDPWNAGKMTVTHTNGKLMIDMPDLDTFGIAYEKELIATAKHNFTIGIQGGRYGLTFMFDDKGEVDYARVRFFVEKRTTAATSKTSKAAPPNPNNLLRLLKSPVREPTRMPRGLVAAPK